MCEKRAISTRAGSGDDRRHLNKWELVDKLVKSDQENLQAADTK